MKRPVRPWICGALVLASCLALSARGQCQYEITQIYQGPVECTFDASITFANDLNDHGQACGAYYPCSIVFESRAWVSYGEGHFQVLNPPGAIESSAEVILNDGRVAGWYYLPNFVPRGFIYDPRTGQYTILSSDDPSGGCVVRGMNEAGQVVGSRNPNGVNTPPNAFIWQNGIYTDLGVMNGPTSGAWAINQRGAVVGWTGTSLTASNVRGFIRESGETLVGTPIPGGFTSEFYSVNSFGDFAGAGKILSGNPPQISYRALAGNRSHIQNLGTFDRARSSLSVSINDAGEMAGVIAGFPDNSNLSKPAMWRRGVGVGLIQFIVPDPAIYRVEGARGINNSGELICEALESEWYASVSVRLTPMVQSEADLDHDCRVDVNDLLLVIRAWGMEDSWADLNANGVVDLHDLMNVLLEWSG